VATKKIFNAFLSDEKTKAFLHGHSFTGNPMACAAACASLDLFENEKTWTQINSISKRNSIFCEEIKNHTAIKSVRTSGTILAVELNDVNSGYFSNKKELAYHYFLEHGLLLRPLGNVIFINPPYCLTEREHEKIFKTITNFLNELHEHQ
jgi:adenosylmethionine-8-amino-7-oxononanoate aminotransferase